MPKIHWYWPETGKEDGLYINLVRRVPGIKAAHRAKAEVIGQTAEAIFEPHHRNNDRRRAREQPGVAPSYITVTSGHVDSYVNLIDPGGAAGAIEKDLGILRKAGGAHIG